MRNKKILLSSGILAVALLGANFSNSINDVKESIVEANEGINNKEVFPGETEGVYDQWISYDSPTYFGYTGPSDAYVNYRVDTDELGNSVYTVGYITKAWGFWPNIVQTPGRGYSIELYMNDLNALDTSVTPTEDPLGQGQGISNSRNFYTIRVDDDEKFDYLTVPTSEAEWPFSLDASDIYGVDPQWDNPDSAFQFMVQIPITTPEDDPYVWDDVEQHHLSTGMHEESNFTLSGMKFSGQLSGSTGNDTVTFYVGGSNGVAGNVTDGMLANQDQTLWLRFPAPEASVTTKGDLASGYDVNVIWDHTPTPLNYSTVTEIKYTLTGPESKSPDSSMQVWDEWIINDEGASHKYRTSVNDSTIVEEDVITNDGSAIGDLAQWMDGTSDGDINIAGNISDPNSTGGTAITQNLHYGTDYLFTGAGQEGVVAPPAYNVDFSVTGSNTDLGFDNSFVWTTGEPITSNVDMNTAVYEPEQPILKSDISISTFPAHNIDGEITTAIDFAIDGKGEDDFDGSGYTPSGVYKVEIVDTADSNKTYGSMDITPDSKGDVSGTIISNDLPANQHMELALKIYYGHNGYDNSENEVLTNDSTLMNSTLSVDTKVRGSVDKTAALAQNTIGSDTATVDLDINDVAWDGQSYAVADYAPADVVSITIDDVKNVRPDSDDKKQWTVDPTSLDAEGKATVTLDGLYPNTDYEFVTTVVYKGESSTTSNGITEAEADRTITSNTVSLTTNTKGVYNPSNIEITIGEPIILDNRQIKYDYTIDMDVSAQANASDEYDPTLVTEVRVYVNDSLNLTLKEGVDWNESEIAIVDGNETPEHLRINGTLNDIPVVGADSTIRTEIDYAGGTYSDAPTQTINPHDRGISDIIVSDPVGIAFNDDGLTHRLEFSGTVQRSLPAGTSGQATDVAQFATNTYDKIEIIDVTTGMVIATGDASSFTPSVVTKNDDIPNTADVDYTVMSEVLNPNKQYDVYAKVYYTTDSTMAEFENETATRISKVVDGSNGETDADPVTDPLLTIEKQPEVILDNETRNFTASGTVLLDTVGQFEYNSNNSSELPTNVQLIELIDAEDETKVFASHEVTEAERIASEIRWDWTIGEEKLSAKSSYDLEVRVTHAGGTKTYSSDINHIKFYVGSRGELQYTGIVAQEIRNEIGPKLTLGLDPTYYVNKEGDFDTIGYGYSDYELATINNIGIKFEFMQDIDYPLGSWKDPSDWDDWKGEEYIYEDHDEHIYDGTSVDMILGIEELIQKLPFGPVTGLDENTNDKPDASYWYKFTVEANVTSASGTERYSFTNDDTMVYHQMDFEKGPYTPYFRGNELDPIDIDYENGVASVSGRFWLENRSDDFYLDTEIYDDTVVTDYYELGMWGTGLETVKLYDVTGLEPDETGSFVPTEDNMIQDFSLEISSFTDEPGSFKDTSNSNEAHNEFESWLNDEHSMKEFTIEGLTPGQSYSYEMIAHYNGDPDGTHTNDTDPWDGEGVNPNGYDSVWTFEVTVPRLGERELMQEDVQFTSAKSSLTSWTLGYAVAPLTEDDRYDSYTVDKVSIIKDYEVGISTDKQNIITSIEGESSKQGNLVVEGMIPGQSPVDSDWSIVVETTGGQIVDIALTEDWLAHGGPEGGVVQTVEGEDLATKNVNPLAPAGDDYNWIDTPKGQTETWDLNEPLIADDWSASEITDEGFILSATKGESYDSFVIDEIIDESTLEVMDIETGEILNSELLNPVTKSSNEIRIQISGLENSTVYGEKGFDISFEVVDPNSPTAIEGGIPLVISETGTLRVETLNKLSVGQIIGITIGVSASILIPLILILLLLFWFFILVRKVKEVEIKEDSVTFTINRKSEFKDRLKGAKLQNNEGKELNFSLSDIEDKVTVTVDGYDKKQPLIKGLKFIVDNSSIEAENKKLEIEFNEALATYEAELSKWEKATIKWNKDNDKANDEGKEFTKEKPSKPNSPVRPKLIKPFKDVSIFGSIKTLIDSNEENPNLKAETKNTKSKEEITKTKTNTVKNTTSNKKKSTSTSKK